MEEKLNHDARRDITTEAVLKNNKKVYGFIQAKEKGVLAGLDKVLAFYTRNNLKAKALKKDGDRLKRGDKIAEIEAHEKDFLKVELTVPNMLQRMSGIATETKRFAD